MATSALIPHLFRTEFSKMVSVLVGYFGMEQMAIAEDIASETFAAALETWPYKGLPENPAAWLYAVAKNKAINHLNRERLFRGKIHAQLETAAERTQETIIDISENIIVDSQLQMLFAVCHPALNTTSQVCLALRILCGFGIDEIAHALLSNKETINKRLARAKEKIRSERIGLHFPPGTAINKRLDAVLTTLYLLFSEGYYSETDSSVIRESLCEEAMQLVQLLISNHRTCLPQTQALFSLMCFQASRFKARKDETGETILYKDQDSDLWDQELISKGVYYLHLSSTGNRLSRYHIEAAIAYQYTVKEETSEKWTRILKLYDHLLRIYYSPVAALNRNYAYAKVYGKQAAISETEKLKLVSNPYYYTLLGELYDGINGALSRTSFEKALLLASTDTDKKLIRKRLLSPG